MWVERAHKNRVELAHNLDHIRKTNNKCLKFKIYNLIPNYFDLRISYNHVTIYREAYLRGEKKNENFGITSLSYKSGLCPWQSDWS